MKSRISSASQEGECPGVKELSDFNTGKLPLSSIERIAKHLGRCPACEESLLALQDNDDLMIAQLREADKSVSFLEKSEFFRLQSKAKQILPDESNAVKKSEAAFVPPAKIARYSLIKPIGEGGFGKVYLAKDDDLDRFVAIKIPHSYRLGSPEDLENYQKEARVLAGLDHPNIVPVYDVGQTEDGLFYFVSKYIDGNDLSTIIKHSSFNFRESANLIAAAAHALDYAHNQGLVHRDIKSRNILIDEDGEPHVMDFGLAKQESSEHSISSAGQILGTPAYMSPEQAQGEGHNADRRSDIYSLGVVLYELLTGERPFRGDTQVVINQVLNVKPRSPRKIKKDLPRGLETICLKAMAKDPNRRYATAKEMALDLERFLHGKAIKTGRIAQEISPWKLARRHPVAALSILMASIATASLLPTASFLYSGKASENTEGQASNYNIPSIVPNRPPGSPSFAALKPASTAPRVVKITTDPSGASIVFHPLGKLDGAPRPRKATRPIEKTPLTAKLPPGDYLVVAFIDNLRFHEVYRRVPASDNVGGGRYPHHRWKLNSDDIVELPSIEIPKVSKNDPSKIVTQASKSLAMPMALIEGTNIFQAGAEAIPDAPPHFRTFRPIFIDCRETSLGEYKRALQSPAPSLIRHNPPPDNHAVVGVSWDEAVYYAELMGKRLPSEFEYEFVATQGGTKAFPWGDASGLITRWEFGPTGESEFDNMIIDRNPPIYNMYSNVVEWTMSIYAHYPANAHLPPLFPASEKRVARGGPVSVMMGNPNLEECRLKGPRVRNSVEQQTWTPGLGFRCVRSAKPRLTPEDFIELVEPK